MIPLHVWLPEAHPVAPSNVSALMSGVMLKTSIYGIVRVTFDFLKVFPWWWGGIVLVLGLISAVLGVLYALMQHDLKRLLAYHSVENIGIILIGLGLAMIFTSFHLPLLAALALIAALYHTLNHAMFKGLLFMGAGAVLHATHERNMEEMGGLIHRMPWTSALFLVGCISISALPPFNGFVSEWLTFQAFLLSPALPQPILNLLIPLGAALLALTGALAAACFVKAFGVTFLGHWRGHHRSRSDPRGRLVTCGPGCCWRAHLLCCSGFSRPSSSAGWTRSLNSCAAAGSPTSAGAFGWMWLTPIAHERASYSGPIVFIGILAVVAVTWLLLHRAQAPCQPGADLGLRLREDSPPACSTPPPPSPCRSGGFSVSCLRYREQVEVVRRTPVRIRPIPGSLQYRLRVRDRFWNWFYAADG